MGISRKSFKGLRSRTRAKVIEMNKQVGYARATNAPKVENWQTQHKGYGEPIKTDEDKK